MNENSFTELLNSDGGSKDIRINRLIRKIHNERIREIARKTCKERNEDIELMINEIAELSTKVRSLQAKLGYQLGKEVAKEKEELKKEKQKYINMQSDLTEYEWKKEQLNNINLRLEKVREKENNYHEKETEGFKKCEEFVKENEKKIIDALSNELIRWTEENDIDNQRSQGYLIGINKAKKVVRETYESQTITSITNFNKHIYPLGIFR